MIETMKQLERLFAFWPRPALDEDAIRVYAEAARGMTASAVDVRSAVDAFIFGRIDRNHGFIPPPGELCAHICIKQREREDFERRNAPRPRLPAPETVPDTPESAGRRKADVDRLMGPWRKKMAEKAIPTAEWGAAKSKAIIEALGGDEATIAAVLKDNAGIKLSASSLAAFGITKQDSAA